MLARDIAAEVPVNRNDCWHRAVTVRKNENPEGPPPGVDATTVDVIPTLLDQLESWKVTRR